MEAYIKAISYYLPEKIVTNEQLVKEFPEWSVDKIAKKVGIYERHISADNETAGDMAFKAAEKLIHEHAESGLYVAIIGMPGAASVRIEHQMRCV